jgi:predicted ABC-type transport system involved in lysophospholipase L1 biosynthesis ATPase subunit
VDTKELTQKDEDDLKELVASTCHLINASNHVIVAVNMLDNIPPNQHLEGKSNSLRKLNSCKGYPIFPLGFAVNFYFPRITSHN